MDEKSDPIRVFYVCGMENNPFAENTAHAQKKIRRGYQKPEQK